MNTNYNIDLNESPSLYEEEISTASSLEIESYRSTTFTDCIVLSFHGQRRSYSKPPDPLTLEFLRGKAVTDFFDR